MDILFFNQKSKSFWKRVREGKNHFVKKGFSLAFFYYYKNYSSSTGPEEMISTNFSG